MKHAVLQSIMLSILPSSKHFFSRIISSMLLRVVVHPCRSGSAPTEQGGSSAEGLEPADSARPGNGSMSNAFLRLINNSQKVFGLRPRAVKRQLSSSGNLSQRYFKHCGVRRSSFWRGSSCRGCCSRARQAAVHFWQQRGQQGLRVYIPGLACGFIGSCIPPAGEDACCVSSSHIEGQCSSRAGQSAVCTNSASQARLQGVPLR